MPTYIVNFSILISIASILNHIYSFFLIYNAANKSDLFNNIFMNYIYNKFSLYGSLATLLYLILQSLLRSGFNVKTYFKIILVIFLSTVSIVISFFIVMGFVDLFLAPIGAKFVFYISINFFCAFSVFIIMYSVKVPGDSRNGKRIVSLTVMALLVFIINVMSYYWYVIEFHRILVPAYYLSDHYVILDLLRILLHELSLLYIAMICMFISYIVVFKSFSERRQTGTYHANHDTFTVTGQRDRCP